jgi:hypothetical protein
MKKQTAVDWLAEQINGKSINYPFSTYADITISIPIELFEQAKQMEKEQIKEAYNYGWDDRHHDVKKSWLEDADENYYNETYGQ